MNITSFNEIFSVINMSDESTYMVANWPGSVFSALGFDPRTGKYSSFGLLACNKIIRDNSDFFRNLKPAFELL